MLRFHLFIIIVVTSLSHELTAVHHENTTKVHYYKHTEPVLPEANISMAKDEKNAREEQPLVLEKKESTSSKSRKRVLDSIDNGIVHQNDALPLRVTLAEKSVHEEIDETPAAVSESKNPNNSLKLPSTTQKSTTPPHATPIIHVEQQANTTKISTTETGRKFNPKPTVTFAEGEAEDESMPHFPTSKTLLGTPRKIDYIVPVIITITALPLLGAAFYVLYKRGRDYWDKRHYRRMDFLIDGMYNE